MVGFRVLDASGLEPRIVVGRVVDVIGVDVDTDPADQTSAEIVDYAEAARCPGLAVVQPTFA